MAFPPPRLPHFSFLSFISRKSGKKGYYCKLLHLVRSLILKGTLFHPQNTEEKWVGKFYSAMNHQVKKAPAGKAFDWAQGQGPSQRSQLRRQRGQNGNGATDRFHGGIGNAKSEGFPSPLGNAAAVSE